ncbi:MAG TPA: hypothetical protein VGP99_03565 [Tepidisphaeraceae bacterium]|jgi:hypothetical protein|nr:hypothetical protein [Tepidisphaeraceae bacterium]
MPLVLIKSDPRAREKPCLRCGYSLRKIVDARNCPECGLSVWISLNNNDSLDWSRPDWLRVISLGALVMAAAQGLGIFAVVVLMMPWLLGSLVSAWVVAVYLLALSGGMILLAAPEKRYPDKLKGYRWFLVAAAIAGGLFGSAIATYAASGRSPIFRWAWLYGIMQILLLISAVATLLYLRKLAHRLGTARLAKVLGWLLLIPLLKFVQAFPFWGIYLGWQFLGIGELLPWLYIPISLGILIYLAIAFRKAANAAEVNWASAG